MAIGDFGSNNSSNRNTIWNPTCYSRYRFKNDNLSLDTSFNNGLMKMEINEFADGKPVPKIAIYLSPIKALLLAEQIVSFVDYRDNTKKIDTKVAFGVNAGMGEKVTYIGFSTDEDKKNYITIGKFNGEGVIIESYKFQLQQDYHYALDWTNIESNEINKNYKNDMLHLDQLEDEEQITEQKHVLQTKLTKESRNDKIRSSPGLWNMNETYVDGDIQVVLDHLNKFYYDI